MVHRVERTGVQDRCPNWAYVGFDLHRLSPGQSAAAATVAGAILGVAGHAIAAGSYGWIVKQGVTECKGDGGVSQGDAIVSHTSGQVDTMADGEEEAVIGVALEDDGSAGDLFTCKVFIP